MEHSALFVCCFSKDLVKKDLDFEILGSVERRNTKISKENIISVLIPEIATSEHVNQRLTSGVHTDFVPMKQKKVTLVLGKDTFDDVFMTIPNFETTLQMIHQHFEKERTENNVLDELECKYLIHIARF